MRLTKQDLDINIMDIGGGIQIGAGINITTDNFVPVVTTGLQLYLDAGNVAS